MRKIVFNRKVFSQELRKQRKKLDVSLRVAGELSGVKFVTLGRLEKGGEPSLDAFCRCCIWMRLDPSLFIYWGKRRPDQPEREE